jgi:hypothetical protein
MAKMPARSAAGRLFQRSTTRAKSGDFRAKSAKQDAKTPAGFSVSCELTSACGFAELVFKTSWGV